MQALEGNNDMVISFQYVREKTKALLNVEKYFRGKPVQPTLTVLVGLCTLSPRPHVHDG